MILGEPVDRLGRHIFDRRNADHSWSGQATRFIQRPVGDMRDVDLRHCATCMWVTLRDPAGRWIFSEIEVARIMGWSDLKMMLR